MVNIILGVGFGLYGIVIGSFLNVVILRTPIDENLVTKRSHCMSCGHVLSWFELIPLFSYLFLGGKCRHCKEKISIQYPIIEALNGILYVILFLAKGVSVEMILYCLCASALLSLSVIDWRTYEIPLGLNLFILFLGLIRLVTNLGDWSRYVIGLFAVSGFLLLLWIVSKGRAIGDGDIILMAATGLLLGWQLNITAFLLGCILGSIIHLIRMAISKESHVLSFGPYLSAGVLIAMIWGEQLVSWYLRVFGLSNSPF